jgi:hypothetical protein
LVSGSELAVTEAGGFVTSKALSVRLFVTLVVTFVPHNFTFAFKGKYVGSHTVEKPSIVADDDGATSKIKESFLKGAQSVDVKVVGRFIQKEEVAAILEQLGQVNPVTFSA